MNAPQSHESGASQALVVFVVYIQHLSEFPSVQLDCAPGEYCCPHPVLLHCCWVGVVGVGVNLATKADVDLGT